MGYYYSDDPIRDLERHQSDQEEWLKTLPVCAYCDEPIQDEEYYNFDGDNVCDEHLREYCDKYFKVHNTEL